MRETRSPRQPATRAMPALLVGLLVTVTAALPTELPAQAAFAVPWDAGTVLAEISVPAGPRDIVVTPDARYAYVTTRGDKTLEKINLISWGVERSDYIGYDAGPMALTENGTLIVGAPADNLLVGIDVAGSLATRWTLELKGDPMTITPMPGTVYYLVTERSSGTLRLVSSSGFDDLNADFEERYEVGGEPWGAVMSANGDAYVALNARGELLVVPYQDENYSIDLKGNPTYVALSPNGLTAYVSIPKRGEVAIVETLSSQVTKVKVGGQPWGLAVAPDGSYLYVTDRKAGELVVLDLRSTDLEDEDRILARIPTGGHPEYVAVTPNGLQVIVSNRSSDTVSIIRGWTDEGAIVLPSEQAAAAQRVITGIAVTVIALLLIFIGARRKKKKKRAAATTTKATPASTTATTPANMKDAKASQKPTDRIAGDTGTDDTDDDYPSPLNECWSCHNIVSPGVAHCPHCGIKL